MFIALLQHLVPLLNSNFQPSAIVLQCGADGLFEDPNKIWNLTEHSFSFAAELFVQQNVPLLVLGGGGYNHIATAKCWTHVLAKLIGHKLENDVPEHDFFSEYGPDFVMKCEKGNMINSNTPEYVNSLLGTVEKMMSESK